jgi:sensory rhodopsin
MVDAAIWFGITTGTLGLAVILFTAFAVTRGSLTSLYYFLPPAHALVAMTAYLGMTLVALESGIVPEFVELEMLRYGDWTLSTPILTYYFAMLAGVNQRLKALSVGLNVGMITTGYASLQVGFGLQAVLFIISSLFFVGLLYLYLGPFTRAIRDIGPAAQRTYLGLRDLTILVWSLYPVVYIAGPPGLGVLMGTDYHLVTMVLDMTAKIGFMGLLVVYRFQIETLLSSRISPAPQ